MEKIEGRGGRVIFMIILAAVVFYALSWLLGPTLLGPMVDVPEESSGEEEAAVGAEAVRVRFEESDELLGNPGMGWQTFFEAAEGDDSLAGLPSSVYYHRFGWGELQERSGEYDWTALEEAIEAARRSGQTLAFRVSTTGTNPRRRFVPEYLEGAGCRIHRFKRTEDGPTLESPDFDDPVFLREHLAFIRALGERYNGHEDVCLVDVGSVGLWGEWHMSGTDVAMPTEENALGIIDAYREAFPDTPIVMQLDYIFGMKHARELGMGWRVDCWGDMRGFSKTWCHMGDVYPQAIVETGVGETWKEAPVALETCWDMRKWAEEGWDIDHVMKWALQQHASFINNKSAPVPAEVLPKVRELLLKVGYRFVLRSVEYPGGISAGGGLSVKMEWENVGVAPCYYDFYPAVALADGAGKVVWSKVFAGENMRGRLPGEFSIAAAAEVGAGIGKGRYDLLVCIVGKSGAPEVKIAIDGARRDGWYGVGKLDIK